MRKLLVILFSILLVGCTEIDKPVLLRHAKKDIVWSELKDYIGINGYVITYKNYKSGIMRVSVGYVVMPQTKTYNTNSYANAYGYGNSASAYGNSITTETSSGGHGYSTYMIVNVSQSKNGVIIQTKSTY